MKESDVKIITGTIEKALDRGVAVVEKAIKDVLEKVEVEFTETKTAESKSTGERIEVLVPFYIVPCEDGDGYELRNDSFESDLTAWPGGEYDEAASVETLLSSWNATRA